MFPNQYEIDEKYLFQVHYLLNGPRTKGGGGTDIERGMDMYGPEDPLFTPLLYVVHKLKGPISSKRV